ncbi:hypothetical protein ACYB9R_06040 [Alcaligenes aquatilis]|uniref:Cation-translocating P-type ATPase n=2 Tax=Alcaligenes TaxID=507 RepID=A0ABY4NEI1_9BURK|nr:MULTISPECIES: hypothetical protein [Alcaligenes]MCH4224181.1 hypothetical protein [Alcaligenes faecalis]UQN34790.1 hypothetical protein MTR80_10775 [Alcaligenes aquatilis]UYY85956.1 hypothetical protein OKX01_11590 [Alcaligenes sp. SMD-FA]
MRAYSIFSLPKPLTDEQRSRRRHTLARLGLSWLAAMQVMMFAFPGYMRSFSTRAEDIESLSQVIVLMNWAGLCLTMPVVLYCAWPILKGAVKSLSEGRVGMDVPVALGIVGAFLPSVYNTWTQQGEVYYDSVTMFVAFLLTARYLELCARQSVTQSASHDLIERFRQSVTGHANTLAFWFVSIQLVLAAAFGLVWYWMDPSHVVPVVVAMLVMSCPCAMSMSVPSAVASAHAGLLARPAKSEFEVVQLTQQTGRIARQNLYGSIVWHLLMTPLAALGIVAPWLAAVSMLVSSLAVAANSWRIYRSRSREVSAQWTAPAARQG